MNPDKAAKAMERAGFRESILQKAYGELVPDHEIAGQLARDGYDFGLDEEGLGMGQVIDGWVLREYEKAGLRNELKKRPSDMSNFRSIREFLEEKGAKYIDQRVACKAIRRWGKPPAGRPVPDVNDGESYGSVAGLSF